MLKDIFNLVKNSLEMCLTSSFIFISNYYSEIIEVEHDEPVYGVVSYVIKLFFSSYYLEAYKSLILDELQIYTSFSQVQKIPCSWFSIYES